MRIVDWCIDNLTYTADPPQHDALWILRDPTHRAQCAGYSHMAIALAKAVGIPARMVGGFSISEPYYVPGPPGHPGWDVDHGQGTHAWLEIYYPDTGWIPYDAQMQYQYTDTHVYKSSIGIDVEGRRPYEWAIWYWGPETPTYEWVGVWNSGVVTDNNELQYYATYPTPGSQAFGDRVVHMGAVELTDSERVPHAGFGFTRFAPNPFATGTVIEYSIPRDTHVRIAVFDVRGREVACLLEVQQGAGAYLLRWGGRDSAGRELPSGIYFCRLQAGTAVDVRKMVRTR